MTKRIIDAIMPYYPKDCIVIAGYLDDSDQYWKVNYHWEYLVYMIDTSLTLEMSEKHRTCTRAIRAVLTKNAPSPTKGYRTSSTVGLPKDVTPRDQITQRWKSLRQSKKDFKSVIDAANLAGKKSPKKAWDLAVAPVAAPGTSKHGAGYALDISGDNAKIKQISKALGASLTFDEKSHVHVEFADGVNTPEFRKTIVPVPTLDAAEAMRHYADDMCVLSPEDMGQLPNELRDSTVSGDMKEHVPYTQVLMDLARDLLPDKLPNWRW